MAIRAINSTTF